MYTSKQLHYIRNIEGNDSAIDCYRLSIYNALLVCHVRVQVEFSIALLLLLLLLYIRHPEDAMLRINKKVTHSRFITLSFHSFQFPAHYMMVSRGSSLQSMNNEPSGYCWPPLTNANSVLRTSLSGGIRSRCPRYRMRRRRISSLSFTIGAAAVSL